MIGNTRRSLEAAPLTIVSASPARFERAVTGMDWLTRRAEFKGLGRHAIDDCAVPTGALT